MTWVLEYTAEEGGAWRALDRDVSVDQLGLDDVLEACRRYGRRTAFLAGIEVHSLRFTNGREWDVVNGWRAPSSAG